MPRKNNPQQTIDSIISVSLQLFMQKGYDKTSMQDIVNALGMSKGAIFHHFKSKAEIFNAVMVKQSEEAKRVCREWIAEMDGLTGKEKLTELLDRDLKDQQMRVEEMKMVTGALESQTESPHLILGIMRDSIDNRTEIFAGLLKEGIEDGSITAEFPDECAEIFLLLSNVWCDHMIFKCDMAKLTRRVNYMRYVMKKLGADVFTDELTERWIQLVSIFNSERD